MLYRIIILGLSLLEKSIENIKHLWHAMVIDFLCAEFHGFGDMIQKGRVFKSSKLLQALELNLFTFCFLWLICSSKFPVRNWWSSLGSVNISIHIVCGKIIGTSWILNHINYNSILFSCCLDCTPISMAYPREVSIQI